MVFSLGDQSFPTLSYNQNLYMKFFNDFSFFTILKFVCHAMLYISHFTILLLIGVIFSLEKNVFEVIFKTITNTI